MPEMSSFYFFLLKFYGPRSVHRVTDEYISDNLHYGIFASRSSLTYIRNSDEQKEDEPPPITHLLGSTVFVCSIYQTASFHR